MKIIGVQSADRRHDKRFRSPPIRVELEGHTYETLDWSLGGFLIGGYGGHGLPGEQLTVGISVLANGHNYEHVARAEIVRLAAAMGYLGARFTELDAHTVDTLEGWMTGRLRRRRLRVG